MSTSPSPGRALAGAALAWIALLGAARPVQIDSQVVLQRYAAKLLVAASPPAVIFTYTVSQAGPHDIEQTHLIYRSGIHVRDETLAVDGVSLKQKFTRIARYRDRYAIARIAPRTSTYTFLFERVTREGSHYDYTYAAIPLVTLGGFVVDRVTIDGATYLPSKIEFTASGATISGKGVLYYAPFGRYWMPVQASVAAKVEGRPARERIAWSGYRFPSSLPESTFVLPKPLPAPVLPTF